MAKPFPRFRTQKRIAVDEMALVVRSGDVPKSPFAVVVDEIGLVDACPLPVFTRGKCRFALIHPGSDGRPRHPHTWVAVWPAIPVCIAGARPSRRREWSAVGKRRAVQVRSAVSCRLASRIHPPCAVAFHNGRIEQFSAVGDVRGIARVKVLPLVFQLGLVNGRARLPDIRAYFRGGEERRVTKRSRKPRTFTSCATRVVALASFGSWSSLVKVVAP